jgi:glycosyltransferase involved in cell wall biosynthesis
VVDDGSTDDTVGIAQSYGSPVRLLRQENRGAATARNRGIAAARGQIVAFLDADDLWHSQKLERQIALFQKHNDVAMVFTGHDLLDASGRRDSERGRDKRARLLEGNLVRNIFMSSGVATPTVAVRRSVFDSVGVFDEELEMAEDDNLWMRIACRHRVELIDEPLATIRLRSTSISRDLGRLLHSVELQIDAMQNRYSDVWNEVHDLVPEKLVLFHFALGRQHLAGRRHDLARRAFAEALRLKPNVWRYRAYYWVSLLPGRVLEPFWKVRGWLKGQPGHG